MLLKKNYGQLIKTKRFGLLCAFCAIIAFDIDQIWSADLIWSFHAGRLCVLQGYRPCAQRASILFFVLNDMGRIDPMYQFSLDAYIELFVISIDKSHRSSKLDERINNLNEYHTFAVYRWELLPLVGLPTYSE